MSSFFLCTLLGATAASGAMTIYGSRISTADNHPIYEVDVDTGGLVEVGNFPFSTAAVALGPADGLLYYTEWDVTDGRVATWNPTTGMHSVIGNLGAGVPRFARLGFRLDGVLYGMDDACRLYTIDTGSGSATLVGTVTGADCTSGDLAFGIDDTLFLSAGSGDSRIYLVDTGTLVAAEVHDVTTEQEIAGLVVEAAGDLLSVRTRLLRFDSDTYAESTIGVFPVGVRLSDAASVPETFTISGTVFEDVNYGGGIGRDLATSGADAPSFAVERGGVIVELYDLTDDLEATTSTAADGSYGFVVAPGSYTVRVVNETVTSSRPGSDGSELPVQTYRADGSGEASGTGATLVGGDRPAYEDASANSGAQTLAELRGTDLDGDGVLEWVQSIVLVDATIGDVTGIDFGFNFDTVVNTHDGGQGTLRQFILNSNLLK